MSKFKKGDVVRLKSGGPKMTVQDQTAMAGHLNYQWFDGTKLLSGVFDEESLAIAKDESGPPGPSPHFPR